MKTQSVYILLILALSIGKSAQAQDSTKFIFNEFSISVNYTQVANDNTSNRFGFGAGAYRVMGGDKVVNPVIGIEFNQVNQFKAKVYEGRFAHSEDVTYHSNFLTIPLGLRFNVGTKTKVFLETGGFADIALWRNKSGTLISYLNNHLQKEVKEFDEKAPLQSYVGFYLGIGFRIPISKYELVISPEYKYSFFTQEEDMDEQFLNNYLKLNVGFRLN